MNFIEELFFGNLDPQRRGYTKNSYIVKVSSNVNELEEKLTERLQGYLFYNSSVLKMV